MTDRTHHLNHFLSASGWGQAKRAPLAGDASNRRYERVHHPDGRVAVLMDAPPSKGEDVRPFVRIADYLSSLGLSAPKILHKEVEHGFLLLEDLGDDLFARVVVSDPNLQDTLYQAATDTLVALHKHPAPPDLAVYSAEIMTEMSALAYVWYIKGCDLPFEDAKLEFKAAFKRLLIKYAPQASVLIQRDYHAENLLWLPDRQGIARVGLLDFQDAMAGHPAYDLVSFLQDARRDVPPELETAMIARYVAKTQQDKDSFLAAYHVLGAQRNLRILGVFARLSMQSGKPHYIDFIPRVWGYLLKDLAHPALAPIANIILRDLPEPKSGILQKLRDKCANSPVL